MGIILNSSPSNGLPKNDSLNPSVSTVAVPVTGFFMTSYHGYGTYFFFWEFPPPVNESNVYILWGLFHKYLLPYLLYIVLGAHILGTLKHHFYDKHTSAIKRMNS